MHVPPRRLPRRTWRIRHVGRCREAGEGRFSRNKFSQGSGEQENLRSFKKTKTKDARFLKPFNLKGQSTAFIVSPLRSTEDGVEEGDYVEAASLAGLRD